MQIFWNSTSLISRTTFCLRSRASDVFVFLFFSSLIIFQHFDRPTTSIESVSFVRAARASSTRDSRRRKRGGTSHRCNTSVSSQGRNVNSADSSLGYRPACSRLRDLQSIIHLSNYFWKPYFLPFIRSFNALHMYIHTCASTLIASMRRDKTKFRPPSGDRLACNSFRVYLNGYFQREIREEFDDLDGRSDMCVYE